ncbi:MAG: hypothetical protein FD157_4082 [Rhodocyclaceae bacterium]|nr:MAG: hypothetical protein FD157_4082 [Rhodocyclaceae bacterium]TNC97957.1 MAG: hypothetical protein FD118_4094 [Rhodocyclaceae bacterium]
MAGRVKVMRSGIPRDGAGDTAMEAWSSRNRGQDQAAYGILSLFSGYGNGLSGSKPPA